MSRIIIRKRGGRYFQEGGEMMPEEQMPAAEPANPQMELEGMLTQYAQNKTPEVAMLIADFILVQMMESQQATPATASESMPADATDEMPMAGRGMGLPYKLNRR